MASTALNLAQIPDEIRDRAIICATVGSTAHGVSVSLSGPEGDDLDLMGAYVPPRQAVYGLQDDKTIVWRSKPEGLRSEAGDVDLTLHPLRKFLQLAYKGNPTILAVLFSGEQHTLAPGVTRLLDAAGHFCSLSAGYAFRGYAENQYQRLTGERGQLRVNRPELVDAYGYDVKYAAHTLRLCEQGVVMLERGFMPMPLDGASRDAILAVRRGEVTYDDCLEQIQVGRARLDKALDESTLPRLPDAGFVNTMLIELHEQWWSSD